MAISSRTPNGIGFVAVATPGTPVPLSATQLTSRLFQIRPAKGDATANTGNIYIGSAAMVRATGVGVYALIKTGDAPLIVNRPASDAGIYDLSQWYMDADNAADGALVGYEGES